MQEERINSNINEMKEKKEVPKKKLLFENEEERFLYEEIIDLKVFVPEILLSKKGEKTQKNKQNLQEDEKAEEVLFKL